MNLRTCILKFGLVCVLIFLTSFVTHANKLQKQTPTKNCEELSRGIPPVALNDTFVHIAGIAVTIKGNVLLNDYDPNGDSIAIYFAESPREAFLNMMEDGNFELEIPTMYAGNFSFEYYIKELTESEYKALALVYVEIVENYDLDEVADLVDLDNDNDGIPDKDEGYGNLDSDNDGISNNYDIDSDNDGITDNIEWQKEHGYIPPSYIDANNNGWDDAYDTLMGGTYYSAVDTDGNGVPDIFDKDSDKDGRSDLLEAFDFDQDGKADLQLLFTDSDKDGLDDAFDSVFKGDDICNSIASTCQLIDANNNGIRDWRDFTSHFSSSSAFVYPNPISSSYQIHHPDLQYNQSVKIQIYDLRGQLIQENETEHSNDHISAHQLLNGIYILKASSHSFIHTQRIVVKH